MIRRKRVVLLPPDVANAHNADSATTAASKPTVAAFFQNLQSVGYFPTSSLFSFCETLPASQLTDLYDWLMPTLKQLRGDKPFDPMYRNFPLEVMQANEAELYLNAVCHYFTNGKWFPDSRRAGRPALDEPGNLLSLDIATIDSAEAELRRLASANSSISVADKEDLRTLVDYFGVQTFDLLPPTIPNRENKAVILALLLPLGEQAIKLAHAQTSTATDVLRLAVALSDGDVSLAEPTKFRSFRRPERRLLLDLLESQSNLIEDMRRWTERWKRLGERLHPGEHAVRCPKSDRAFTMLRDRIPFESFNTKLERALATKDVAVTIQLLTTRPGDFARRLDHVVRITPETARNDVLQAFRSVASRVSTPVLFQVLHHFRTREAGRSNLFFAMKQVLPRVDTYEPVRVFLPKGAVSKAQVIPNRLPRIPSTTCDTIANICQSALISRFESLPSLGHCYIDPALRKFAVPFSQRSAAKSLRTIARGSRLALPDADTLRFFIWWKNGTGRTDLDLSAAAFKADFIHKMTIAYYNLKDFGGHHSGDIVDAPEGASEFIDISISRCREQDIRYIAMIVNSFTQQPYCDLPECFAGWMARKQANSGEIYEPRTVSDRLDLTANTRIAIPAIFDLETREVLWLDLALTSNPSWVNNVASNLTSIQLMLRAFSTRPWPCLYDLLHLHVTARGSLVNAESEADTVFSVANETPFHLEKIASEFLANADFPQDPESE